MNPDYEQLLMRDWQMPMAMLGLRPEMKERECWWQKDNAGDPANVLVGVTSEVGQGPEGRMECTLRVLSDVRHQFLKDDTQYRLADVWRLGYSGQEVPPDDDDGVQPARPVEVALATDREREAFRNRLRDKLEFVILQNERNLSMVSNGSTAASNLTRQVRRCVNDLTMACWLRFQHAQANDEGNRQRREALAEAEKLEKTAAALRLKWGGTT